MIGQHQHWVLTVEFWPVATVAGLHPLAVHTSSTDPAHHVPAQFHFQNPPSREDFLEALPGDVFLYQGDQHSFLSCVRRSMWPMVFGDAADVSNRLITADGRVIGRLSVRRQTVVVNFPYAVNMFTLGDVEAVLEDVDVDKIEGAKDILAERRNAILERFVREGAETPKARRKIMADFLQWSGFDKPARLFAKVG